jgi:hypothetical protein
MDIPQHWYLSRRDMPRRRTCKPKSSSGTSAGDTWLFAAAARCLEPALLRLPQKREPMVSIKKSISRAARTRLVSTFLSFT